MIPIRPLVSLATPLLAAALASLPATAQAFFASPPVARTHAFPVPGATTAATPPAAPLTAQPAALPPLSSKAIATLEGSRAPVLLADDREPALHPTLIMPPENSTCYKLRTYEFTRDDLNSPTPRPSSATTCPRTDALRQKRVHTRPHLEY